MTERKMGEPNFSLPFNKWRKIEKDEALRLLAKEKKQPRSIFEMMGNQTLQLKKQINDHFGSVTTAKSGRPKSIYTEEFITNVLDCMDRGRAELALRDNLPPEKITIKAIIAGLIDDLEEKYPGYRESNRNAQIKRMQNMVAHAKRLLKNRDE